MRIKSLISLATVALLVTACSDENEFASSSSKGMLRASVEGSYSSTRAGFTSSGQFYWSLQDKLGVTTINNETETEQFSSLNLETGGGTASGTFSGTITGTIGSYAVYPCNDNHKVSSNTLTYNFPASYTYKQVDDDYFTTTQGAGNSFNPAMWGKISGGSVTLKHLGGVFCIKVPKMPVTAGTLSLIADKKIAGSFTVDISNTSTDPVITTTDASTDAEKIVSIAFSGATENQPGVFYVPVPTGTYSVRVKILVDEDEKMNVVAGSYTIARCDLKKLEFSSTEVDAVVPTAVTSLSDVTAALKGTDSSSESGSTTTTTTTAVTVSQEITANTTNTITIPTVAATSTEDSGSDEGGSETTTTETTMSVELQQVASGASITVSDAKTSETSGSTTEKSVSNFTLSIPNNETTDFKPLTVEIAMPSTTVTLAGNAGAATYGTVTASTADNTLVIDKDVTVKKVIVKKGNIRVNKGAKLVEITKDSNFSGTGKVTIYKEEGAELPSNLSTDNFEVVSEEGMTEVLKSGGIYTLFKDMVGDFVVSANSAVTINLNGHKITNKSGDTFTVNIGSSLTIQGNGTVDNVSHGKACVYNNGTVALNGGTYTRSKENGKNKGESGGNSYYNILNHGTMTIAEGVAVKQDGHFSSMIANGYYNYSESSNPRSGYQEGTNAANPTLSITAGTFSGGLNTVKNDDGAELSIIGGTFSNVSQAVVQNHNKTTISGGTFDASSSKYVVDNEGHNNGEQVLGDMTISGGTFTGILHNVGTGADLTITAGTFSDPSALQYLGENANVTIKLDKDYTLDQPLVVAKTATLDLNGFALKANSSSFTDATGLSKSNQGVVNVRRGGNLTIKDSSTEKTGSISYNGQSEVYSAIILTRAQDEKDGSIKNLSAELTVEGGHLIGKYYGISGNGTRHGTNITIKGGVIEGASASDSDGSTGIYHPQDGTLTISGGEIKGVSAAVELRSGTATVSGGKFTATATEFSEKANGSGTTMSGVAFAISQHSTDKDIKVTISGGEFTGVKALRETDLQNETGNISLTISGGTFNGEVYSKHCKNFITGGTFINFNPGKPSAEADSYLANDYSAYLDNNVVATEAYSGTDEKTYVVKKSSEE